MEVSGIRHILSAALRGHAAKGIDIYLPSMARPFLHLAMRSKSPPRAIIRLVQCLWDLSSEYMYGLITVHFCIMERANTALRRGIGFARWSQYRTLSRLRLRVAHPRATPSAYSATFKGGRKVSLHRAGGGSHDGKRGIFPLLSLLITIFLEFYDFDARKSVKFSKNGAPPLIAEERFSSFLASSVISILA